MIWGIILQVIGIILTASGSILALTKLFQGYFKRLKLNAALRISYYKEYKKYDDEHMEHEIKSCEEALKSDVYAPEYKQMRKELLITGVKQSIKKREDIEKNIMNSINAERRFIIFGVCLIIAGSVLQAIGIIIS